MNFNEILGQILGILVTIGCIATTQLPKRWHILLGSAIVNLGSALNLLLVNAGLSACIPCAVAVVHCLVSSIKAKKGLPSSNCEKIIFSLCYLAAWGLGFSIALVAGNASWTDFMPLAATAFFVASVFMPKERNMRLCSLCNAIIYTIYDIIIPNTAVVAQIFTVISILIALFRYREKKPKAAKDQ
jgi:hypothetical protein